MKIKERHKELFRFYMSRGISGKAPFGKKWFEEAELGNMSAVECFTTHESTGVLPPCCSPLMVRWATSGKALVKLTIDNWMEDIGKGLLFKFEVMEWIEGWPQTEKNNVVGRMFNVQQSR
tara:strand:+ start:3378 stop:3737 length:360 start_codon:yes stop_codon:yes gene_type:complete